MTTCKHLFSPSRVSNTWALAGIMIKGALRTVGSSQQLKAQHGSGYRVALEQNGSRRDLGRFNDVLEAALAYAQYVQGRAAAATAPPAAAARPGGKRKRAQEPPPVAAEERSEEGQGS